MISLNGSVSGFLAGVLLSAGIAVGSPAWIIYLFIPRPPALGGSLAMRIARVLSSTLAFPIDLSLTSVAMFQTLFPFPMGF